MGLFTGSISQCAVEQRSCRVRLAGVPEAEPSQNLHWRAKSDPFGRFQKLSEVLRIG